MSRELRPIDARAVRAVVVPPLAVVAASVVFFPMPFGAYLNGVLLGLYGAMVALGMALIYRSNRIINFAQADLGLVPTTLAVLLIVHSGLNYFLALGIGLAAALVLGAVVELVVIRRFFRSPRLILTVATIGLSQLLTVAALLVPSLWGLMPQSATTDVPGNFRWEISPFVFEADDLLTVAVIPAAMVAVALFLRFTRVGIAVRASAERADRAALLGVPVRRLQTVVWVIATVLSFTGLFLKSASYGLPLVQPGVSLSILLGALAALMLGRLTNLPAVVLSAIALGVLEQGVDWGKGRVPLVGWDLPTDKVLIQPILGLVIIIALLFQKVGASRAEQDTSSSWTASDEVRPVPRELARLPEVRLGRVLIAGLLALVAAYPVLRMTVGDQPKATTVVIFAIIGISVVVLTGWAGQVSLGQLGFAAIGGGVSAVSTVEWGLDLSIGLLAGGLVGALVAVVVGLPALRLRGLFLAVTTLAFALGTSNYLLNPTFFDWIPRGQIKAAPLFGRFDLDEPRAMYLFSLAVLGLVALAVRGIRAGRTGRVLLALRENERGAQAYGISVTRAKLTAFALSGFLAALGGGLLVHNQRAFDALLFAPAENLSVFTAAVVGGLGSLLGGVIGALYLKGGQYLIPDDRWRLLASSAGVLFVLLVIPGGLGDVVYRVRDTWLRSVARRNAVVVPSLVADVAVDQRAEDHDALEHAVEHATETDVGPPAEGEGHGPAPGEAASSASAPVGVGEPLATAAEGSDR